MIEDKENGDLMYLNYNGPFSIQIISGFAKFLSESTICDASVRRKLYRVFIEMAQNLALYSFDRVQVFNGTTVGSGKVYIIDKSDIFKCVTVNKILKDHASVLTQNCHEINTASDSALKARKRGLYELANARDTGAHIGLIMIYGYSGNPVEFEIIESKEGDTYFKLAALINKT